MILYDVVSRVGETWNIGRDGTTSSIRFEFVGEGWCIEDEFEVAHVLDAELDVDGVGEEAGIYGWLDGGVC